MADSVASAIPGMIGDARAAAKQATEALGTTLMATEEKLSLRVTAAGKEAEALAQSVAASAKRLALLEATAEKQKSATEQALDALEATLKASFLASEKKLVTRVDDLKKVQFSLAWPQPAPEAAERFNFIVHVHVCWVPDGGHHDLAPDRGVGARRWRNWQWRRRRGRCPSPCPRTRTRTLLT